GLVRVRRELELALVDALHEQVVVLFPVVFEGNVQRARLRGVGLLVEAVLAAGIERLDREIDRARRPWGLRIAAATATAGTEQEAERRDRRNGCPLVMRHLVF